MIDQKTERLKAALTKHVTHEADGHTECYECMRMWKTSDGPQHDRDCPLFEE